MPAWSVLTVPNGRLRSHDCAALSIAALQAFSSTRPARPRSSRSSMSRIDRLDGSNTTACSGAGSSIRFFSTRSWSNAGAHAISIRIPCRWPALSAACSWSSW